MVGAGGGGAVEAGVIVGREPVWKEFLDGVGLDDGARENVCTELAGLLEEENAEFVITGGGGELFKADGGSEARGACGGRLLDGMNNI